MNSSFEKNDKWIFLIPVDGNANKNINKKEKKILDSGNNQINKEKSEDQQNIKNLNNPKLEIDSLENNSNMEVINENKNNFPAYSYSIISKSKNFCIADSSKFYISECLKKNWKIRIKRLIIKLKKRYTKQANNFLEEDSKDFINNEHFNANNISNNNNLKNLEINNNNLNFTNTQNNYYIKNNQ